MKLLRSIGFGITLFGVMFVIGSIIMFGLKLSANTAEIAMYIALIVVLLILIGQYRIGSFNQGVRVGLVWMIVYALLDYLVVIKIFNPETAATYYLSWSLYIWYALIVIVPALIGFMKKA